MSKLSKLASGIAWGSISKFTVIIFQLIFMAVMARLLNPEDFGLVAIANVCLRFFSYFAQMGMVPALIQKESLDDGDIRAALALSLGVSSFFFVLAASAAGLVESFFEMASLADVVQALAFNFIVVGFSSVSLGLIQRNKKFKALAIIEIISYVIGYGVVGLNVAYVGAGVWALVAALLTQTLLTAVLSYWVIRHPLELRHTKEQRSHFIGYGGRYSINGFIEFLSSNVDALVIGKFMGAASAGYYNRALLLANLPVQNPANILTRVLFPIMSGMSNQHDKQSMSVQLSGLVVGCYAFAVAAGVYVAAPDIVKLLLGDKWLDAIPVLQVLVWSVGPLYVSHVIGVTLDSMAELSIKFRIQLFTLLLLMVLICWATTLGSITKIAMAVVVVEWLRVCLMCWVIIRLLKIPMIEVSKIISCVTIVTATTSSFVFFTVQTLPMSYPVAIRIVGEVVSGALGMGIGLSLVRFIFLSNPAVIYLVSRLPILANILPVKRKL